MVGVGTVGSTNTGFSVGTVGSAGTTGTSGVSTGGGLLGNGGGISATLVVYKIKT